MKYNLVSLLNDRENKIIYDKNLRNITWSLTSAILLQQIIYWSEKTKWEKFFKFIEPCNHELYKEWDSWCEELWFSRKEFDWAIKKIWFKLWKNNKNQMDKENAIIIYYTDSSRITWYSINYELLNNLLYSDFLVIDKRSNSKVIDKMSDTNNTEITTKITSEILSKDNTEQSSEIVKVDKRDLDIDLIIEALKECNMWIIDDTVKKQRQYWKLIKDKLLKIRWFDWRYVDFINMLYDKSDEYRRNHFRSAEKFYYNLANIVAWIKIHTETKKWPLVC